MQNSPSRPVSCPPEKVFLVNVGSKHSPERVVEIKREAIDRGMTTSELLRTIVDEYFRRGVVEGVVEGVIDRALSRYFPERVQQAAALVDDEDEA